jgi:hypothetical protein
MNFKQALNMEEQNIDLQNKNIQKSASNKRINRRSLIPVFFALTIIFFFFSFCELKCGNYKIASKTGIELIISSKSIINSPDSNDKIQDESEFIRSIYIYRLWTILTLIAAVIGLIAYLIKSKHASKIGMISAIIGISSLMILYFMLTNIMSFYSSDQISDSGDIGNRMTETMLKQVTINFQFGYYGAFLALLVAGYLSYMQMKNKTNKVIT